MTSKIIFLFLWLTTVFAVDFDCIVVGTSPISLFEAIYKTCQGYRVLVVEQAGECGGAWKSISICGIEHVDLGCHEFGKDARMQTFLEEYAGCTIVPNAPPYVQQPEKWGMYPLGGCYELTHHLEFLMESLGTTLWLHSRLESVFIDAAQEIAEVQINGKRYTTAKIIVTNCSEIYRDNASTSSPRNKYPHIYLLFSDPTPSRFTYTSLSIEGVSRAMNVTQFAGLEGSGKQLVALQLHNETFLDRGEKYFNELKKLNLIDASAELSCVETYIFEQGHLNRAAIEGAGTIFEVLDTGHIANISKNIEKWKTVMKPWKEIDLQ